MDGFPRKSLSSRLKWKQVNRDRALPDQGQEAVELAFADERSLAVDLVETSQHRSMAINPAQRLYHASIIMPVYNEQACIGSTFDAVMAYCKSHPNFQFIFVNDGSAISPSKF